MSSTLVLFCKDLEYWTESLLPACSPCLAVSFPWGLLSLRSFPVPFIISFDPMAFTLNHVLTGLKCEYPPIYPTLSTYFSTWRSQRHLRLNWAHHLHPQIYCFFWVTLSMTAEIMCFSLFGSYLLFYILQLGVDCVLSCSYSFHGWTDCLLSTCHRAVY